MLALIAVVGLLSMLLMVTTSIAYLVLPRGRMCPRCGGSTSPVVLRRAFRVMSRWIQWRWCSRCAWEGPGRRGPELGILDPPADHESGFRWGHPNLQGVPVFYWKDENETTEADGNPPVHPSGFQWGPDQRERPDRREVARRRQTPRADHPSGFHFRSSADVEPAGFQWGPDPQASDEADSPRPGSRRPWFLTWFIAKEATGFQWKAPD